MASVNPINTKPLYVQLRDLMAQRISTREWTPSAPLPNEIDLSREFQVSIGTVRKALALLEDDRLIRRQQGRGTFVNDLAANEFVNRYTNIKDQAGNRIGGRIRKAVVVRRAASHIECDKLGLMGGGEVFSIQRVRTNADRPFMIEQTTLPVHLLLRSAPEPGDYRIAALAQANGLLVGRAIEQVTPILADEASAALLNIATGTPILELDRIVCLTDGRPLEWRHAVCHLQHERYVVTTS
ncbi:MAG: GntR family transcriptional regulator [Hyphomicrobium sp.]|nr:GntR family transcriptional regulator [Hyphomicrobium sp.]